MAKRKKATSPATIKVKRSNGKNSTYKKVSCGHNKTSAKSAAKKLRDKGHLARVVGGCVYKGPKK